MKEKNKKILAGLGIGLMLAGSGIMMTGCSGMEVTQDQIDKVFTALDNANQFMSDTKYLIGDQNNELDNLNETFNYQNQELTNIKNILSKEDQDLLFDNALKKYNYAMNKLHLNKDNVWDNLKITWDYNGSDGQRLLEMHYYKFANNTNVFYSLDEEKNIIVYIDNVASKEKFNEMAYNACAGTTNGDYYSFTKDEIVSVEILDNGNYKINVSTRDFMGQEDVEALIDVELTTEGSLISINYCTILKMDSVGYGLQDVKCQYEYGVLAETEVQANIDAYNESQSSSDE